MHIPDGMLGVKIAAVTAAAGAAALTYALCTAKQSLKREDVPRIAAAGAFIFAAQMLNFPIPGGTSGHFLGGAFAFILFGPRIGLMMMSAVLGVQALFFQDGGILALGANMLCTGLVGGMTGYAIHRFGSRIVKSARLLPVVSFAAAWGSIVAASGAVGILLALSGVLPLGTALSAMVGWHALIGIGEGIVTAIALGLLTERRLESAGKVMSA